MIRKISAFILLVITVIFSQTVLLENHLGYGFSDVDWGFLSTYKEHRQVNPDIFKYFLSSLKEWGVYTHQEYYIGFQSEFFGLNLKSYQIATHVFKILATIASYLLFLYLTRSILAAFAGTILFAVAYPAVGTMYTVVTSSDYLAVLFMILFFGFYFFLIKNNKQGWYWQISVFILLLLTLFLSTERMYPVIFFIFIIEIFLLFFHKFSKNYLKTSAGRFGLLLSPFILAAIFVPNAYASFIFGNGGKVISTIWAGDLANLLRPFISMGGLIVPNSYWKYFGIVNIQTFNSYLNYFITGPAIVFMILTPALGYLLFNKVQKFLIHMSFGILLTVILSFLAAVNHRQNFDQIVVTPALIGGYLVSLGLVSFIHWLKYQPKDRLLISFSAGLLFTFIYLVLTWIASDLNETPTGSHRYSTVPSLITSFAIGALLVFIAKKFWLAKNFLKLFSIIPILILIVMVAVSTFEVKIFFQEQLKYGFGANDKQLMREQLLSYLNNLSEREPSLFYFDFNDDRDNAYYYDNTLLGGFGSWMFWHPKINFKRELAAFPIWSRFDQLSAAKVEKNGKIGFLLNNQFYSLENFYAFKLKDKKIYNIKDDIIERLK